MKETLKFTRWITQLWERERQVFIFKAEAILPKETPGTFPYYAQYWSCLWGLGVVRKLKNKSTTCLFLSRNSENSNKSNVHNVWVRWKKNQNK